MNAMRSGTNTKTSVLLATLVVGACAMLATPAVAEFREQLTLQSGSLVLRNLIGEIQVEGHSGSAYEIEINVRGRDASRENLRVESDGGEVLIVFPVDRVDQFVYPKMGRDSNTTFDLDEGGSGLSRVLSRMFGGKSGRVKVRGSGSGMEIWADVIVRVPASAETEIDHGVGTVTADGVEGSIRLSTRSGHVEATQIRGDLDVDTGSGRVTVADVQGGDVSVDTGSGSVELTRVEGDRLSVDTGSGRIRFDMIVADSVSMDTGSGSVSGDGLSTDSASVDTGSGSVELGFDRVGTGRFEVDTGSGSIRLRLPPGASALVRADSGSGGIDVDIAGAQIRRMERDEAEIVLGAGDARFDLSTGSGGIKITQ